MTVVPLLRGWLDHEPPIVTGAQRQHLWTLADLGDREASGWLVSALVSLTRDPQDVSLTPVRWAVWAALELLVVPLAHDGIEIDVEPDQLGVVLSDGLAVEGHWLGDVTAWGESVSAHRVGRRARLLAEPVVEATCRRGVLRGREAEQMLRGTIASGVRRIEAACHVPAVDGWADDVLAGALGTTSPARRDLRRGETEGERAATCATA